MDWQSIAMSFAIEGLFLAPIKQVLGRRREAQAYSTAARRAAYADGRDATRR